MVYATKIHIYRETAADFVLERLGKMFFLRFFGAVAAVFDVLTKKMLNFIRDFRADRHRKAHTNIANTNI